MAIITNTEVKDYLAISDSTIDTIIDSYIDIVQNEIEDWLGQKIETTSKEYIFSVDANINHKLLPNTPLNSLTKLEYRALPSEAWTEITEGVSLTQYDNGVGVLNLDSVFVVGLQYKASYSYGYVSIPNTLKKVAIEKTATMLLNSNVTSLNDGLRHGLTSRAEGIAGFTGTTSFKDENYLNVLQPYSMLLI